MHRFILARRFRSIRGFISCKGGELCEDVGDVVVRFDCTRIRLDVEHKTTVMLFRKAFEKGTLEFSA